LVSGAKDVERMVVEYGDPSSSKTGNGSGGIGGDKTGKTLGQSLKKLVGIDLGLGALLKQSQIFTGYLGNIFAIVGALIDTILAPLAPIAFKALADLGKKIPMIAAAAEKMMPKVVNFIGSIFRGVDKVGKFISRDWAKWAGLFLAGLVAINLTLKMGRLGGSVLGLRSGGATRGIMSKASSLLPGRGVATVATQGTTTVARGAATSGGGMLSRFAPRALGTVGKVAGGAAGGIIGGITGYSGGRNKGMSKGMSIGRGVTSGAMATGGAILGSALGPLGTMAGGALGATAGNWLFDKMFDKDSEKGGGRGGMDVAGQQGLAGYSVPLFIASSTRKFSDKVTESGVILSAAIQKTADTTDESVEPLKAFQRQIVETTVVGAQMSEKVRNYIRQSQITSAIEKDPMLAFVRGAGGADVRTNKKAMDVQRNQLMDEIIKGKRSKYSLASSLGFEGTDYTVSGSGDTMKISQAGSEMEGGFGGKEMELKITFGGHDGTQQIIQYEQNGKRVDVKFEEDYSTSFP
jgi:hypothetical protein